MPVNIVKPDADEDEYEELNQVLKPEETTQTHRRVIALKKFITYCCFLLVLCAASTSQGSTDSGFYQALSLEEALQSASYVFEDSGYALQTSTSPRLVKEYIRNALFPTLLRRTFYNGEEYPGNGGDDDELQDEYQPFFVEDVCMVLGVLRVRQVRMEPGAQCAAPDEIRDGLPLPEECAGNVEKGAIDKSNLEFGNTSTSKEFNDDDVNHDFTKFRDSDELSDGPSWYSPLTKLTYPAGGLAEDMPNNLKQAQLRIDELWAGGWVDELTRSVFVDFTCYNPNDDEFTSGRVSFELLPQATIKPRVEVLPAALIAETRALKGDNGRTKILFGFICHTIVFILSCQNLMSITDAVVEFGSFSAYISKFWNQVDTAMSLFFVSSYFLKFAVVVRGFNLNYVTTEDAEPNERDDEAFFTSRTSIFMLSMNNYLFACGFLLAFLKMTDFLKFSIQLSHLVNTIANAMDEVVALMAIFVTLFVGFGIAFHLTYGTQLAIFRDFPESLLTLYMYMLGDINTRELSESAVGGSLGIFLFALFVILIFMVGLSLIIKIVIVGFEEALDSIGDEDLQEEYDIHMDPERTFAKDLRTAIMGVIQDNFWTYRARFMLCTDWCRRRAAAASATVALQESEMTEQNADEEHEDDRRAATNAALKKAQKDSQPKIPRGKGRVMYDHAFAAAKREATVLFNTSAPLRDHLEVNELEELVLAGGLDQKAVDSKYRELLKNEKDKKRRKKKQQGLDSHMVEELNEFPDDDEQLTDEQKVERAEMTRRLKLRHALVTGDTRDLAEGDVLIGDISERINMMHHRQKVLTTLVRRLYAARAEVDEVRGDVAHMNRVMHGEESPSKPAPSKAAANKKHHEAEYKTTPQNPLARTVIPFDGGAAAGTAAGGAGGVGDVDSEGDEKHREDACEAPPTLEVQEHSFSPEHSLELADVSSPLPSVTPLEQQQQNQQHQQDTPLQGQQTNTGGGDVFPEQQGDNTKEDEEPELEGRGREELDSSIEVKELDGNDEPLQPTAVNASASSESKQYDFVV